MTLTLSYLREALIGGGSGPHGLTPCVLFALACGLFAAGFGASARWVIQGPAKPARRVYGRFPVTPQWSLSNRHDAF